MDKKCIIDIGTSEIRFGISGEVRPNLIHPNQSNRSLVEDAVYFLSTYSSALANSPTILVETNRIVPEFRREICQFLFERANISSLYIAKSATMRIYAAGRSSGNFIEFSESATEMGNVEDGYLCPSKLTSVSKTLSSRWETRAVGMRAIVAESIERRDKVLPDGIELEQTEVQKTAEDLVNAFRRKKVGEKQEIVFGGRAFLHPGILRPFADEVKQFYSINKLAESPEFIENGGFIGASILGVVSDLDSLYVTREEWKEGQMRLIDKQFH